MPPRSQGNKGKQTRKHLATQRCTVRLARIELQKFEEKLCFANALHFTPSTYKVNLRLLLCVCQTPSRPMIINIPRRVARSSSHLDSTNITEGESMLPYSPSTAHESEVCSSVSPRPFCASSMMRRPPGWTHQKSTEKRTAMYGETWRAVFTRRA